MLYGNITNTSHTSWQFDRIYPSRYAMESNLYLSANDEMRDPIYIAPGRFVLISYSYPAPTSILQDGNTYPIHMDDYFLCGYVNSENQYQENVRGANDMMFVDSAFSKSYKYTEFTLVSSPVEANISTYYIKRNGFYFKAPYWVSGEAYYIPTAAIISDTLVTTGQIIRRRRVDGSYTNEFYKCVGPVSSNQGTIVAARFEPIDISAHYVDDNDSVETYVRNFAIDKNYYYDKDTTWGTLHRGYDGTVWQKVIGEGEERYVLVAHLNALMPGITIIPEPPTDQPVAPFFGAESTDMIYKLHLQTPWGYQLEAYPAGDNGTQYSDLTENGVNYKFYYNKDGLNKEIHVINDAIGNEIAIHNNGQSDDFTEKYRGSLLESNADIKQISVMLPAIGNMVAEGYDLIYGNGSNNSDHKRALDTQWYGADNPLMYTGHPDLGGKTFDLSTLAGTLNTYHNRLGQVIETVDTRPNSNTISALWSVDNLYYVEDENKYFRKGINYTYRDVDYVFYECTSEEVNEYNYLPYTYYISNEDANYQDVESAVTGTLLDNTDNHVIGSMRFRGDEGPVFDPNLTYYRRVLSVSDAYYSPITLTQYQANTYFRKRGANYYRDNRASAPTDATQTYVSITKAGPYNFTYTYAPNMFYVETEDGDYIRSQDPAPLADEHYYNIYSDPMYSQTGTGKGFIYQPGFYYYFLDSDHTYAKKATEPTFNTQYDYYVFKLSDTPVITGIINDNGDYQTTISYTVESMTQVYFYTQNNNETWYYIDGNDNYRKVTTDWLKSRPYSFFSSASSYRKIREKNDISTAIFSPGKYYIEDPDTGDLLFATADTFNPTDDYYTLTSVRALNPFYVAGKYFFKTNQAQGESNADYAARLPLLDNGLTMRDTSTGQYYRKAGVYITEDLLGECPFCYEWNSQASLVPWVFTLKTRVEDYGAIEVPGVDNGENSINSQLLRLAQKLELNNDETRDENTLQGALNKVNDKFYMLGNLTPGKLLYVNEYGRISNSNIANEDLVRMRDYDIPTLYNTIDAMDASASGDDNQVLTAFTQTNGKITASTLKNVGTLKLAGYEVATGIPTAIATTDTINTAFGKLQRHIDILTAGSSTEGSVAYQIAQIVNENNNGSIDTLNEIAAWIINDSTGAAKMSLDISTLQDSVGTLEGTSHSHSNKALLDTYTQTEVDLADAVTKKHSHANSTELNLIQAGDVTKWNNKQDAISANTYDTYGAAADVESAVTGTNSDTKADLTLNGLLAYIEELEQRIIALEPTAPPTPAVINFTIDNTPYTANDGTTYGEEFTDLELTNVYLEGVEVWDDQDTYNSDNTLIVEGDAFTTVPPL